MNVLMLSRGAGWLGGVVNFVDFLKNNFSQDVVVTDFKIGERKERRINIIRYFQPFIDAIRLFNKVRNTNFDVIHINPSLNKKALLRDGLFMLVLRFTKQRVLVFFHGWDENLSKRIRSSQLRCFLMNLAFGSSSTIFVLADGFRYQLIEMGVHGDMIATITTMFDGKQLNSVRAPRKINGKNILFLSRFIPEKGLFELIEAFAKIVKRFPESRMVMAGDGPARSELEQAVMAAHLTDKVLFTGYVRGEEKATVLADADIFVLPSYSEGCPVSMLEAMAAGQALVSTPVGGIPDILHDGVNGFLIDSADPDLIYDALYKLMSSPELVRKISETNKEVAWRCYEASVITAKIEEYYRKAIL